jgi:hypothetical protein
MSMLIPLGGFIFGIVFGRWWALLAVAPFAAWFLATNELEGHIGAWVAGVLSLLLACAIAAGVGLRRLNDRRLRA